MGRKRNLLLVNPCPQKGSCFKNGDSKPSTIVCCPEASGRSYRHYENQCRKSDGTRWKTRRLESKGRRFRSWDCTIQNGRQQNSTQAFLGKHEDENHNWCCYFRHRHYYYNCCVILIRVNLSVEFILNVIPMSVYICFFTIKTMKEFTFSKIWL